MTKTPPAELIARIAAEADAQGEDYDIPATAKISHRNPRAKVLQIRLNEGEYTRLETLAAEKELPVSTVARAYLLRALKSCEPDPGVEVTAEQLEILAQVPEGLFDVLSDMQHAVLAGAVPASSGTARRTRIPTAGTAQGKAKNKTKTSR
ncbi:hypothetical protein [Rhodococcus sp. SJ]|uniref:hypothetical protein n=1 Tax=Rhodococcus sp. SJ TaxID=3434112 RepID=UPI003D7A63C0